MLYCELDKNTRIVYYTISVAMIYIYIYITYITMSYRVRNIYFSVMKGWQVLDGDGTVA